MSAGARNEALTALMHSGVQVMELDTLGLASSVLRHLNTGTAVKFVLHKTFVR
jgi:hypothetical protein